MVHVAVLRHGDYQQKSDTPSAHQLYGLNDEGRRQARAAADRIRDYQERHALELSPSIDTSSLLRGWETATEIVNNLGTGNRHRVESFDELAERCVGAAANLTVDEINQILAADPRIGEVPGNWKSDSDFCLPFIGAESLMMAGDRVAAHFISRLSSLPDHADNQLKIFVVHGASFRHAAYRMGILAREQIRKLSMYYAEPLFFRFEQNGGLRKWTHLEGQWKPRTRVPASQQRLD